MAALIQEAFIQFRTQLQAYDLIDDDAIFIDGTKLEADANKYTFVFRKCVEKSQARLRAQSKEMYETMYERQIIPALLEESEEIVTDAHLYIMYLALETVENDMKNGDASRF